MRLFQPRPCGEIFEEQGLSVSTVATVSLKSETSNRQKHWVIAEIM